MTQILALTGIVTVALIFRLGVKTWVRWLLPRVSSPERIWGLEDLLFLVGYGLDIAHMAFIQKSLNWGLGRHMWFLADDERAKALRNEFISQPLAVLASMFSRSGMMCFLYTCFGSADKHIRLSIVVCIIIQVIANSVTAIQIIVQCGPTSFIAPNRVAYFHYMWDPLPSDGSVACQSPEVQTTIGFVQGGLNTTVDFFLTIISAIQLWRFTIRATDSGPSGSNSFLAKFHNMPKQTRARRMWQTITLSGPLLLSGIASIVKTYLLKSIGDENDITHNTVPFVLWVKIENYSILLATCAPVVRLLIRMLSDNHNNTGSYWSHSRSHQFQEGFELDKHHHTHSKGAVVMSVFAVQVDSDGASTSRLVH
ncbi:hypothetical protein P170DRAFT_442127 [Aspergillus steynii IBT 23096]|uniref:Rhodopsin domain-containing protein n=1 Tax=Aspergillus steynii IBT 23096 TaxID=1392250 RepID=A0A2I2GM13_9EURO|nr:uncharacterized protein P170DRAFT_442127 [Aspergillus steynii IBT 23096]PLB53916.1 hypothetical protein P170DRAFT_442127 [Aspergillus steynii IBT 23096]